MKIKFWGHATFVITDDNGEKIVLDPYGKGFPYADIDEEADIVTISHDHFDHNAGNIVKGNPEIIRSVGTHSSNNIKITGIPSSHDDQGGDERGDNVIFRYELSEFVVVHMGDLGHLLNDNQVEKLKDVNILMIPVGGHFTIDADKAYQVCQQLNPEIIIPMHYKTELTDLPIKGLELFTEKYDSESVHEVNDSETEITSLPDKQEVMVLDYIK